MKMHYTKNSKVDKNKVYENFTGSLKPRGLYYAKNNEWISFSMEGKCWYPNSHTLEGNLILNENVKNIFEIKFKKDINLCIIEDIKDVENFLERYIVEREGLKFTKWDEVAKKHDGIHIENYCEIKRQLPFPIPFATFDVNGGCIWNLNKIMVKKITPSFYNKYILNKYTLKELKEFCKKYEITHSYNKEQLINRIIKNVIPFLSNDEDVNDFIYKMA